MSCACAANKAGDAADDIGGKAKSAYKDVKGDAENAADKAGSKAESAKVRRSHSIVGLTLSPVYQRAVSRRSRANACVPLRRMTSSATSERSLDTVHCIF